MADARPSRLDRSVEIGRDHVLGNAGAEITLVEYGSYACPYCHAAHKVIADLRDRFGDRMRYVFRHLPIAGSDEAERAAELAEYASETRGQFWAVHDALMRRGPNFAPGDLQQIAAEFNVPVGDKADAPAGQAAGRRVRADAEGARRGGALATPTFFINGRRYEGAWDESALAEAMLGSLGHRVHAATLDFVRWAPSAGLLLLLMSTLALILANSPIGPAFESAWQAPMGLSLGGAAFTLPLLGWVNQGLLTIFFLVVGLEIKREFTVGRLATRRVAALPIAASVGGMFAPMRHGPSEPALRALDTIHDRIESPASKLLRAIEPWSSYAVLPIFALANAGVAWSPDVIAGHGGLMLAIVLGLVIGKPIGIVLAAWLAVRLGIAVKPNEYTWRQMAGAGALAGIGFTMSLFIASQAFPAAADFAAAKIAIFMASLIAAALGVAILWPRAEPDETPADTN